MSKRVLLILLPALISFAVIYGVYRGIKPQIQKWILAQVDQVSKDKLPVHLKISDVDWNFLFPEIELVGIELTQKDFEMPTVKIEKITASLDLLALLGGRLGVNSLLLEKPTVEMDLDVYLKNSQKGAETLPVKEYFQWLRKLPVSRVGIHQGNLLFRSDKLKTGIYLGSTDLLVSKSNDRLNLQWDFDDSILDNETVGEVPFRVQGEATVSPTVLDISSLKLALLNSVLSANGSLTDLPHLLQKPQGNWEFELTSDLDRLSPTGKNLLKLPDLKGRINASGRLDIDSQGKMNAGFKLAAQQLKIAQFKIGDVQLNGGIQNGLLKIPLLALTNEAGLLDLKDIQIDFTEFSNHQNISAKAQLKSEQIDLNELLQSLGLGDLPLELLIGANFQCGGPLYPNPDFRCQGAATGDQLEVRTGRNYDDTLVLVDSFKADGDFAITAQDVHYNSQLTVGEDHGTSDGVINYKKGFKINYASSLFHFQNLQRLAGLKLEGATSVQGSTQGNSQAATFQMKLKATDFAFEDFILGSPTADLSYEKGILHFQNLEGSFTASHYLANLDVDLNKKRLQVAGQFSRFDVPEVLAMLQRKFKLPVDFTGIGRATFSVEGPFSVGKLSYDLDASILQGHLAGESYDSIEAKLHSDSGEMKVLNGKLTKNKNEIHVSGETHPDGQMNLLISGHALPLEESENISKLGAQITGLMDIETRLKGFVLDPEVQMTGRIYQLDIEDQDFAESTFDVQIIRSGMNGKSYLFGGQLDGQFKIPFSDSSPFHLDLKATNWNYTTLFALIGGGSLLNEYKSSLTGNLQLSSERGGLWTSSGHGLIEKLSLERGGLNLQNKLPMELVMNGGIASLNNFRVEGDQTYFEARGRQISKEALNLKINGQANLRLFQIFVPFLEDLGGTATITADFSGPLLKPEVLGNANVRNGFAKIKGFPHAFEKTQADIQFSQSKILINGFLGNLAGGTFEGDGSIQIEGPQNLPTNIRAHLIGVNLNVPDRVRTNGDADVVFSGNWFPFTLSGTYHVQGGFVDKELNDEGSENNLKQSSYLPKIILQSAFEPVLLDLNIVLEKPLTIKNSMVDGSVSGGLQVRGAPTHPALSGQLNAEKGTKAIFRDKVFDVQIANVRFNGDSDINPDVFATAVSRIDEYDITMVVQGSAKSPGIKLTSVPPLSDQDIISLIALGVKTQNLEKQVQAGNKAKEETLRGAALGVFTQRGIFKKLQDTAGVQLQFSTSYDDTRNVSVQRVTLSKKLSDRVRASATQTSASVSSSNEYSLQYSFTDNLSAIGRYEDRKYNENATTTDTNRESQSILGIDLEYKKEFK